VSRLRSDVLQRRRAFTQKHSIQQTLLLADDGSQRLGHGECDQEVWHAREEMLALTLQPVLRLWRAALATGTVATAVVGEVLLTAGRAHVKAAARGRGVATQDIFQRSTMRR
jgi:hypothetical protein